MKREINFLLLFIVMALNVNYSQDKITVNGSKFFIAIENEEEKFNLLKSGAFDVRDYSIFSDDSKSGDFKLPAKDILIVIPENLVPNIRVASYKTKYYDAVPSLNDQPQMINDSTILSLKVTVASENQDENHSLIKIVGYSRVRDFYYAQVRIHNFSYDKNLRRIIEYYDIVLETDLPNTSNISENSPIVTKSAFDEMLLKTIANSGIAEQFRIKKITLENNQNDKWINYFADYLKISVANDGIVKIGKSGIENAGFSTAQINPKSFQLIESGQEIPIYVKGEDDLLFDQNDYIEFSGKKNYAKISARVINKNEEEYHDFMDRYTDTTFYFLTWNQREGKRVVLNNISGNISDTLTYYDEFIHLEEHPIDALFYTFNSSLVRNQFPFWETSKSWYWSWLATWSSNVRIPFTATNVIKGKKSRIFSKICSRGSNQLVKPHFVSLYINTQKVDTSYLDIYGRILLGGSYAEWIKEGSNNVEVKYAENNGSTNGACLLDWLEIEYPRKLELQNDSLTFAFRAELQSKVRVIKIAKALKSEYIIYRTKPFIKKITEYKVLNGNLTFLDTVATGYEYSITTPQKLLTPSKIISKKFTNIKSQVVQSDYIAVSNRKFENAVRDYLNTISGTYKVKTSTYFVDDIYDEFGYGYPTPESIKDFIKYMLANSPKPIPSYLTLIGDANYDYKGIRKKQAGVRIGENYVPSYGFPVSDSWYVIYDSLSIKVPQMFVGRIPINSANELSMYKDKVSKSSIQPYDEWNKRFIFFSGGSGTQSELDYLKNVQQAVIDQQIKPAPLAGLYDHFYKIKGNDFGPYSQDYVNASIKTGSIFVSYLGHSGTSTWDNSISDVSQLKNLAGRNYFVSDFGCSTNKFAEPDITCFGEKFLLSNDGQALGYVGNSALGFTSIAYSAPSLLFESFIKDKAKSIGQIHWLTKSKMFSKLGNSETANLFSYSNTLLGDPVLELRIPGKPNVVIKSNDINFQENESIKDLQDSVTCKILLHNYGLNDNRKYSIKVTHSYGQKNIDEIVFFRFLPNNDDSLVLKLFVKNLPGMHAVKVELDVRNEITELYEEDNIAQNTFFVSANQVRDLLLTQTVNGNITRINILSPQEKPQHTPKLILRTSPNKEFTTYQELEMVLGDFFTNVILANKGSGRYWFKYGYLVSDTTWSASKSYTENSNAKISYNDSVGYGTLGLNKLIGRRNGISFIKDSISIGVISAGQLAGQTCIIASNGKNLLDNTFFLGVGICVFDPVTLQLESSRWYELFNKPANHTAFESFVNTIPDGKVVALGISGDAVNNNSTQFKNVLKSLGSTKADSIQFKGSWAFIGTKGGDPKTFIEAVKSPFEGLISITKDFELTNSSGDLVTELIGPVNKWITISIASESNLPLNFNITPIGYINADEKGDTLAAITPINSKTELLTLKYPYAKFIVKMNDDSKTGSGLLKRIDIDYTGTPELGTNYQVVSLSKDSLDQGEKTNLNFSVYNVGESTASNFKVRVDLVKKDNSKEKLFEQVVDSIQSEKKKDFSLLYTTDKLTGGNQFQINIDTEDAITELYKDNNFYSVPFYVKPNNKPASLKLTIDGNDIINGDFISPKPNFKIELNDESLIPITDTSKVLLYMNNKRIYFASNTGILNYSYSSSNPKMIVSYTPTLADGDYTFKVVGKNATDQIIDSTGIVRRFTVKNELQLLNAYNYPNPFKDDTYFTFKLTQIPDELKIIIYTIAGRRIKEIKLNSTELHYDFNRIFWDGRDQDGDLAANGVYLYKIISQKGSEKTELTQKLAILR